MHIIEYYRRQPYQIYQNELVTRKLVLSFRRGTMSYFNTLGAGFFASDSRFKKLRITANLALLTALMLTLMSTANAQQTFGNVRGVVKDPNGAVIAGAKVSITNKLTNNTVTTQSSSEGEY